MKNLSSPEAGFVLAIVLLLFSFLQSDPVVTDLQRAVGVVCLLATAKRTGATTER